MQKENELNSSRLEEKSNDPSEQQNLKSDNITEKNVELFGAKTFTAGKSYDF